MAHSVESLMNESLAEELRALARSLSCGMGKDAAPPAAQQQQTGSCKLPVTKTNHTGVGWTVKSRKPVPHAEPPLPMADATETAAPLHVSVPQQVDNEDIEEAAAAGAPVGALPCVKSPAVLTNDSFADDGGCDNVASVVYFKHATDRSVYRVLKDVLLWEMCSDAAPKCPTFSHGVGVTQPDFSQLLHRQMREQEHIAFVPAEPFQQVARKSEASAALAQIELPVYFETGRTGFEEEKEISLEPGTVIAGRYRVVELLGSATFSRAVKCEDLASRSPSKEEEYAQVCLKVIRNSKEFFDQSLDEIKIVHMLNQQADPDEKHIVTLYGFFYFKEHMILVYELLSDNLYEYSKFNREQEGELYFTVPRLKLIARQLLEALSYVHSLGLVHCDLKPENVLFRSHQRCEVKLIDFGSSCYATDYLSSYIQSRSYRAPEVILGCRYDGRIDVWSLGAILVEMVTGDVLFHSDTVPEMLARIVAVCGTPIPEPMIQTARHADQFVNAFGAFYDLRQPPDCEEDGECITLHFPLGMDSNVEPYKVLKAKLQASGVTDSTFVDFVIECLQIDPSSRPTSEALLRHSFVAT